MLAVLSDTHNTSDHGLAGRAAEAVESADAVVHAGDFTTAAVLDAFHEEAGRLHAVCGNRDDPALAERLPPARTVEYRGLHIALTHRIEGGATALEMFGRERGADLVVSGHTHRPSFADAGSLGLLNPGSHADPRGGPATHAEIRAGESEAKGNGVRIQGELRARDGEVQREFSLAAPTE
jgi:putative phosphoesterase